MHLRFWFLRPSHYHECARVGTTLGKRHSGSYQERRHNMETTPHTTLSEIVVKRLAEAGFEFDTRICSPRMVRGNTPKGQYDIQFSESGMGIRTTFIGRGENPLTKTEFLARTQGSWDLGTIGRHVDAILKNEMQFPWVLKETTLSSGDEMVRILPFGDDRHAPQLLIRKAGATGKTSMEVLNSRTMSPAEAVLIAKALTRAAAIASESALEIASSEIAVAA